MMMRYAIREGLAAMRRTPFVTAGSVLTVMFALTFLGLYYITAINISSLASGIREKVEMEAFLEDPIPADKPGQIGRSLLQIDGIDSIHFVSKEDARIIFREEFGEDISSVLDYNPLPASYRITLSEDYRTTAKAAEVYERVSAVDGVSKVIYRKEMLEFMEKQGMTFYRIALILGVALAIASLFVVGNTIRLGIAARARAIETMKLVGASRWFVRLPFLLEGGVEGLMGGGIAAAVLYWIVTMGLGQISPQVAAMVRADVAIYGEIAAAGMVLGVAGAWLAVWRYIGDSVKGAS